MRGALWLACAVMCAGADLEHRLDALADLSGPAGHGFIGISVVDLASGKTIYRRNDDKLFLPASTMKLLTSAVALLRLGPARQFITQVTLEARGDLVLSGSGDPSLSGRVFPYSKDAPAGAGLKAMDELAAQAVAAGITHIDGDVVGDDSLYPWAPYPPSWTQDDAVREFGAPVSALTVNDSAVAVVITPGARAGEPAELSMQPGLEYYTIDQRVITVGRGSEAKVRIARQPGSRQLMVWGSIPAGHAPVVEELAVDDPALYAAHAFYDALTRRGVSITGQPVARHRMSTADYDRPAGTVVASRTSPPLIELLQTMDKVSQNLFAELMLRETGRVARHMATREAGLEELSAMLVEMGGSKDEARLEDGSGLSRNTLVSPRLMTRVLASMYGGKYREEYLSLLPVGGEDGTLRRRLCCVVDGLGIRAKTGSLSRALALSGYADSKTRGRLAFSILVNDFSTPGAEVRAWIDKIAAVLTE